MAAVTAGQFADSTSNVTSYASGSFTPAANDLLVCFVTATGTVNHGTLSDSQGLGWYLAGRALKASSADTIYCFVSENLAANSSITVTFDCTGDAATGTIIQVARVSGMTLTGAAAVLQVTEALNQAASTPAISFVNNAQTGNPTLGVIANASGGPILTPPTGWTERSDTGYTTPITSAEYATRDSGFTGTTITWGSASGSAWGGIIIELDASATSPTGLVQANTGFSTTTQTSLAVSFNKNVSLNSIIVVGTNDNWGVHQQVSGITDSLGNTYTHQTDDTDSAFVDAELWTANVATAGACTVTVSFSNSVDIGVVIAEYANLQGPFADQVASGNATSGTALSSGATPATTQASEVVIGLGVGNGAVTTRLAAGSGYGHRISDVYGPTGIIVALEDMAISSTGAQTTTETMNVSGHWVMLAMTLQVASAAPPSVQLFNNYQFVKVGDGMSTTEKIR